MRYHMHKMLTSKIFMAAVSEVSQIPAQEGLLCRTTGPHLYTD